jgi:hypothetical protein
MANIPLLILHPTPKHQIQIPQLPTQLITAFAYEEAPSKPGVLNSPSKDCAFSKRPTKIAGSETEDLGM